MTKPDHITSTAPKRIYLDLDGESPSIKPEDTFRDIEMRMGFTWSENCAMGYGIPYVRADLVPTPAASGAAPAEFEPWLRTICITAPPPQAYDLAKQAWSQGMKRGAALASREASPVSLTDEGPEDEWLAPRIKSSKVHVADAYEFARRCVRAALASPQVAPAPALRSVLEAWQASAVDMESCLEQHSPSADYFRGMAAGIRLCIKDLGAATPVQVAPEGDAHLAAVKIEPLPFYHEWFNSKNWGGGNTQGAFIAGWFKAINELRLRGLLAAPVAPQDDARDAAGIERAARYVEKLADGYADEHGRYDHETGATEFSAAGLEYHSTLCELAEGIRALAASEGGKS